MLAALDLNLEGLADAAGTLATPGPLVVGSERVPARPMPRDPNLFLASARRVA